MTKRVLDVGNCDHDHSLVAQMLRDEFQVEVLRSHTASEACQMMRTAGPFDLVLVNRLLDVDGSEGLELIRAIKSDSSLAATSCMLISNYAEYQEPAVAAGAERGFGKKFLRQSETLTLLGKFLRS